jgi:hypothetical protein
MERRFLTVNNFLYFSVFSQQLRGVVGVAILLGLTWAFAIFAIDQASVAFYYLFAIFNSLQVVDDFRLRIH